MYYPMLNQRRASREVIDTFLGYNHNLKIQDGELYATKNMSTQQYPLLANRPRRGILDRTFTKLQAIIAKDALYWVDNGTLYANGNPTGLTGLQTQRETQLVSMGAYICIFPDAKYINTKDLTDFGSMGASWSYSGSASYHMCHQDGEIYTSVTKSATEPSNPSNGDIWIDEGDGNAKEWSVYTETWVILETVYTRVDFTTQGQIPAAFKEFDGVQIGGAHFGDLNGTKILYAVGGEENTENDWIVLIGIQEEPYTEQEAEITIERKIPNMDFVCEAQNRLWGCYYGHNGTETLNEIYCCALGDFKNWEQYLGVSTDSWRASRGSDGPWTGCINYLGSPTFFKEGVIHPVSVSSVGAHQIGDIPARGVQQGSHKSLAIVNETLYYKSLTGVVAYQGGMPADVSAALGDLRYYQAVAGVFGQRYYISMRDEWNAWHFFCFDAQRGLWMHEDELHAECFAQQGDELYVQSANRIIAINGTTGTPEPTPDWIAETGIQHYEYPDRKYVSRFNIRLNMAKGSRVQLYIEYDSKGPWIFMGDVQAGDVMCDNTNSVTVPVRPRRCDHLRIRLEGVGDVRVFSIARIIEKGSDV